MDARGDLYALGVILYELLTRRHPFDKHAGPLEDVLPQMIKDRLRPPPSARSLNPDVSPAVDSILRRCLDAESSPAVTRPLASFRKTSTGNACISRCATPPTLRRASA